MCLIPQPQMPELPPTPEMPMTPPPVIPEPEAPLPPPQMVNDGSQDAPKIQKKQTARQQQQQASTGAKALRIPLNTGVAKGTPNSSGLNIPA